MIGLAGAHTTFFLILALGFSRAMRGAVLDSGLRSRL